MQDQYGKDPLEKPCWECGAAKATDVYVIVGSEDDVTFKRLCGHCQSAYVRVKISEQRPYLAPQYECLPLATGGFVYRYSTAKTRYVKLGKGSHNTGMLAAISQCVRDHMGEWILRDEANYGSGLIYGKIPAQKVLAEGNALGMSAQDCFAPEYDEQDDEQGDD
jgi:hypothetical protein